MLCLRELDLSFSQLHDLGTVNFNHIYLYLKHHISVEELTTERMIPRGLNVHQHRYSERYIMQMCNLVPGTLRSKDWKPKYHCYVCHYVNIYCVEYQSRKRTQKNCNYSIFASFVYVYCSFMLSKNVYYKQSESANLSKISCYFETPCSSVANISSDAQIQI